MTDVRRNFNRLAMLGLLSLAVLGWATPLGLLRADPPADRDLARVEELSRAFRSAIAKVKPAVVTIDAVRTAEDVEKETKEFVIPEDWPQAWKDLFRQLPNLQQPREQRNFGSGMIIRADGLVLTNNHVVAGASQITVLLSDGRQREAELIGGDEKADLAVLRISEKDLPTATFGDSDAIEVGDYCLALGAPFRLTQTVTQGIVSAKGRTQGIIDYENFIQTDAAINPGNSGGPLINVRGEVIGINTAIQTRMGTFNGIGYAIPINDAHRVADLLIEHGRIIRSYLGIVMEPMDPDLAATFGLSESKGVLVAEVLEDSPAGNAGLQHGDIILAFNDQPIESQAHVQNLVAYMPPGTKVKLRIWRDKQEKTVRVTLREQPSNFSTRQVLQLTPPEQTSKSEKEAERSFSWKDAGLTIYPLNSQLAEQYNWPGDRQGLVVTAVNPDGPAARAGISEGDILLEIDGVALETLDDLEKAADSASMSKGIRLYFETHFGKRYFLLRQDR